MVKIKSKKEKELYNIYNNDIPSFNELKDRIISGRILSPSLSNQHFDNIINKFNIDFNNKRVLDLGCGFGGILYYIQSKFKPKELIGVEYASKRVDIIKKLYNELGCLNSINILNYDINYVFDDVFKNKRFDIIMCFEVLEHLEYQQDVVNKIKNKLVDGGLFFGTIPIQKNPPVVHISHFTTEYEVKEKLNIDIFSKHDIILRLPECRFFMYKK